MLLTLITLFSLSLTANAESIKAVAVDNFSTMTPMPGFSVKLPADALINNKLYKENTIINTTVVKVSNAKRGKINAYFIVEPSSIQYNDEIEKVSVPTFKMKVTPYKELDKGALAMSAGKTAVGQVVKIPGIGQGISFIHGIAKGESGNRLQSGFNQVYQDSPLAYAEEGKELEINTGDLLNLKIIENKEE